MQVTFMNSKVVGQFETSTRIFDSATDKNLVDEYIINSVEDYKQYGGSNQFIMIVTLRNSVVTTTFTWQDGGANCWLKSTTSEVLLDRNLNH